MRLSRLLPCLALAACGDNHGTSPDGNNHHPDAPAADTPPPIDAPVDGMPGAGSRVWAIGDFLVDKQLVAGAFTDGATLPFGPSAPTPILVPGGTSLLPSTTGFTANVFDTNGAKVAFVADLQTAGTFDLYVANADGSSPTMLVPGQTNIEIQSVALSPDGTKVAYTADSAAIDNGYDLYVVNTTGTPAPVKVSPDRPATSPAPASQDVFFQVTWSPDSKFLAFSADLTDDGFDQAYCVDTTAATPTAVELLTRAEIATQTSGAQGVRGQLLFNVDGAVFFRARVDAGSAQFKLFKVDTDGGNKVAMPGFVPARGDASAPDIGAFGMTPDGHDIVFSADAPTLGGYNLFRVTFGVGTPTNLTNLPGAGHTDFSAPLWFSPDGTQVATVANFASARNEPFVTKLDGTDSHRLVSVAATCSGCTSPDANIIQWTADGKAVYLMGDLTSNNDTKVYRADPTMTDQAPTLAIDVPTGGDFVNLFVRGI